MVVDVVEMVFKDVLNSSLFEFDMVYVVVVDFNNFLKIVSLRWVVWIRDFDFILVDFS